jgi:hypothetical protein
MSAQTAAAAQMAAGFRTGLADYVGRVEAVQSDLLALYRTKRAALATADSAGLLRLEAPERQAAERLQALVNERKQMLVRAAQFGFPDGSLADLAGAVGCEQALLDRIEGCKRRAAALRREGWVQWVVAKRSLAQAAELLELIAHRGGRPVTYDKSSAAGGGALLDASA